VDANEEDQTVPCMTTIMKSICKSMEGFWVDLITHTNGTFIARDLIQLLTGHDLRPKGDNNSKSSVSSTGEVLSAHLLPFENVLPSIIFDLNRQTDQYLGEMCSNPTSSPAIQLLLQCIHQKSTTDLLAGVAADQKLSRKQRQKRNKELQECRKRDTKLFNDFVGRLLLWKQSEESGLWEASSGSEQHVRWMLTDRSASRVIEKTLEFISDMLFGLIFEKHFQHNLLEISMDRFGNYCLQKLLQHLRSKEQVVHCVGVLAPAFEKLLTSNRAGVVRWLLAAAKAHSVQQKTCVTALVSAVGIKDARMDRSLVKKLLLLSGARDVVPDEAASDRGDDKKTAVASSTSKYSGMGCAMLQSLVAFDFEVVGRVIDSFLACEPSLLVSLACDPTGSRVAEAFLSSATLHFHVKHKFIDKLRGKFAAMADSKFGSFVVETAFAVANKSRKIVLAQELAAAEERLSRSTNGKVLLSSFKIAVFKRAQHVWETQILSKAKRMAGLDDMMSEFMGSEGDNQKPAGWGAGSQANSQVLQPEEEPKKKKKRAAPQEQPQEGAKMEHLVEPPKKKKKKKDKGQDKPKAAPVFKDKPVEVELAAASGFVLPSGDASVALAKSKKTAKPRKDTEIGETMHQDKAVDVNKAASAGFVLPSGDRNDALAKKSCKSDQAAQEKKPKRKRGANKDKVSEILQAASSGFVLPPGDASIAIAEKKKKKPRKFY